MVKPKVLTITEEHHRRPRSIGGSSNPGNISNVTPEQHRAWHVLFGNMNAMQICDLINKSEFIPINLELVCKFINGKRVEKTGKNNSKNKNKRKEAWKKLFNRMSFRASIAYINSTWLDPSYHIYVLKKNKP